MTWWMVIDERPCFLQSKHNLVILIAGACKGGLFCSFFILNYQTLNPTTCHFGDNQINIEKDRHANSPICPFYDKTVKMLLPTDLKPNTRIVFVISGILHFNICQQPTHNIQLITFSIPWMSFNLSHKPFPDEIQQINLCSVDHKKPSQNWVSVLSESRSHIRHQISVCNVCSPEPCHPSHPI